MSRESLLPAAFALLAQNGVPQNGERGGTGCQPLRYRSLFLREIAPAEPVEAREAPVRRPPLAAVLHGQSCQVGVGSIRAADAGLQHQVSEDHPVPWAWLDPAHLGLRGQGLDKAEHLLWSRGRLEDPGIAADPHDRGEDELTERHFSGKERSRSNSPRQTSAWCG